MLVARESFNRHRGRDDGYQPFCTECDSAQKSEIGKGHARLLYALQGDPEKGIPANPCRRLWLEREVYMAMFEPGAGHGGNAYGKGECYWCGGAVNGWSRGGGNSSGYWLDRRSNKLVGGHKAYVPGNCVPCCSPCNFAKGNSNSHVFAPLATVRINQFGWGRVQWDEIGDEWNRATTPDLSRWVRSPQTELPL